MDGVLVDSEPMHVRAWHQAMGEIARQYPAGWFLPWVGVPDITLAHHLQREHGAWPSPEALLADKRRAYHEITRRELAPFPGVVEGLEWFRAHAVPVAVATSAARTEADVLLELTGLLGYFPVRVTLADVSRPKPAPDPFLKAAELLNVEPASCFIVEDSPTGVAAARAAGAVVLAVATSHAAEKLTAAHHVFPNTAEALAWIRERVEAELLA